MTTCCTPKLLPENVRVQAASIACDVYPVNAPLMAAGLHPLQIALMTSKYWGPKPRTFSVGFLDRATPQALKRRIVAHMNAWSQRCGISFKLTAHPTADVRISRETAGYWSYLGTDILSIPANEPTMSLQAFTMDTSEAEFHRVIRHETGHTLGFPHEHMRRDLVARIDPAKAIAYFRDLCGWDAATVMSQVLTPLDEASLMGTPPDGLSIMCYQLPGLITQDGQDIPGGPDIDESDFAFAAKVYPKP